MKQPDDVSLWTTVTSAQSCKLDGGLQSAIRALTQVERNNEALLAQAMARKELCAKCRLNGRRSDWLAIANSWTSARFMLRKQAWSLITWKPVGGDNPPRLRKAWPCESVSRSCRFRVCTYASEDVSA